jgi:putative tryptophan/tyrosine transport system substrate-binding protein
MSMRLTFIAAARCVRVLGLYLATLLLAHSAAGQTVAVVISEETPMYVEIAEHLRRMVDGRNPNVAKIVTVPAQRLATGEKGIFKTDFYQYVITVGAHAANLIAKLEVKAPVLNILIPRALYDRLSARGITDGQTSAIYLDQPHARQLELARMVLPGKSKLCVLYGPHSKFHGREFERMAAVKGYSVVAETIARTSDLGPVLDRSLPHCEFLLALPDADIFNRNTIQQILLTSYHSKDPVIAFSAAHVKSGALAAVFSSPEQIARQTADVLMQTKANGKLPPPQYPTYWSVTVNRHVARSLGLQIGGDKELQIKLGLTEEVK